jgi:hypothetical protein
MATISIYDHTARLFADGTNTASAQYNVKLLTDATFNATHTTLSATGGTEASDSSSGYTAGGAALTGVTVSTVTTNDAMFDADDVTWTADTAGITASYAILYNATNSDNAPLAFIDFGGSQTAPASTQFKIIWSGSGIFSFTVA